MQMCLKHWETLRKAINDAGLESFVARSGQDAASKIAADLSGLSTGLTASNFEPLMGAHNSIVANCLTLVGVILLQNNEDGSERCPLCYAIEHCMCERGDGCHIRKWIDYATHDARNAAIRLGLLASA